MNLNQLRVNFIFPDTGEIRQIQPMDQTAKQFLNRIRYRAFRTRKECLNPMIEYEVWEEGATGWNRESIRSVTFDSFAEGLKTIRQLIKELGATA